MRLELLCFGLLALPSLALADICRPPAHEDLREYTIEIKGELAEALAQSLKFQTTHMVPIPDRGNGPDACQVEEKVWTGTGYASAGSSYHCSGSYPVTIACRAATYCRGNVSASCDYKVVSYRDQTETDFLKILSQAPLH